MAENGGFFSGLVGDFASDFFTGAVTASGVRKPTDAELSRPGQAYLTEPSLGHQAGEFFFSLGREYFKSGKGTAAVAAAARETDVVKEIEEQATRDRINAFLKDPTTWLTVFIAVLAIGGVGFALGKR